MKEEPVTCLKSYTGQQGIKPQHQRSPVYGLQKRRNRTKPNAAVSLMFLITSLPQVDFEIIYRNLNPGNTVLIGEDTSCSWSTIIGPALAGYHLRKKGIFAKLVIVIDTEEVKCTMSQLQTEVLSWLQNFMGVLAVPDDSLSDVMVKGEVDNSGAASADEEYALRMWELFSNLPEGVKVCGEKHILVRLPHKLQSERSLAEQFMIKLVQECDKSEIIERLIPRSKDEKYGNGTFHFQLSMPVGELEPGDLPKLYGQILLRLKEHEALQ